MTSRLFAKDDVRSLAGRKVCVVGKLLSMSRAEFAQLVAEHGGQWLPRPVRSDMVVVIGDDAWPTRPDGSPPRALAYAEGLRERGFAVEVMQESALLEQLGWTSEPTARSLFTVADIARLLHISPARVRRWQRAGILQPVATLRRVAYFDFQQVTQARRLFELLASGVSLNQLRDGIARLRLWMPDERLPLSQLARLEHHRKPLWRRGDRLFDSRGQQHFEFDSPDDDTTPVLSTPASADALFDAALLAEDDARYEEAAALYQRAIDVAPDDPVLHYNLGNVLYALGRCGEAIASFRQATALDPEYVEAWSNLGACLADEDDTHGALKALDTALALMPGFEPAIQTLYELNAQEASRPTRLRVFDERTS